MSDVTRSPLDQHFDVWSEKVLRDVFAEATASYWLHRARRLETALPRPGDYLGRATPEQREVRRARLRASIAACRAAAAVAPVGDDARLLGVPRLWLHESTSTEREGGAADAA